MVDPVTGVIIFYGVAGGLAESVSAGKKCAEKIIRLAGDRETTEKVENFVRTVNAVSRLLNGR